MCDIFIILNLGGRFKLFCVVINKYFLCSASWSKNANNSESEVVQYELEVAAMADVILQGWGTVVSATASSLLHPYVVIPARWNAELRARLFQCFSTRQSHFSTSQLDRQSESEGRAGHRPGASAGLWGTDGNVDVSVSSPLCSTLKYVNKSSMEKHASEDIYCP